MHVGEVSAAVECTFKRGPSNRAQIGNADNLVFITFVVEVDGLHEATDGYGVVTRAVVGVGDIRVVEAHDFTDGAIAPVDNEIVAKPIAQRKRDALAFGGGAPDRDKVGHVLTACIAECGGTAVVALFANVRLSDAVATDRIANPDTVAAALIHSPIAVIVHSVVADFRGSRVDSGVVIVAVSVGGGVTIAVGIEERATVSTHLLRATVGVVAVCNAVVVIVDGISAGFVGVLGLAVGVGEGAVAHIDATEFVARERTTPKVVPHALTGCIPKVASIAFLGPFADTVVIGGHHAVIVEAGESSRTVALAKMTVAAQLVVKEHRIIGTTVVAEDRDALKDIAIESS